MAAYFKREKSANIFRKLEKQNPFDNEGIQEKDNDRNTSPFKQESQESCKHHVGE
jgi:hypothetical protein